MSKVRLSIVSLACAGLISTAAVSMAAGGSGTSSSTDRMDRGGTSGQNSPAMGAAGDRVRGADSDGHRNPGMGSDGDRDRDTGSFGHRDPSMGADGDLSKGMGTQGQDFPDTNLHPSSDTMGEASTDSQSISGEILSVKGERYVVKDATGKEVNLHVDESTHTSGSLKKGDRIEAEVTADGHARSLKKVQRESVH